jgi:hypothetical protein
LLALGYDFCAIGYGVAAASQASILRGERSWLLTHIGGDGQRFIARANEKLTVFVELESAIRTCGELA